MIKISKPAAPAVLQGRGQAKRDSHCADYDRSPAEYDAGRRTFTFDAALYGDATVKEALIAAQHGKCCFCEKKIGAEGDVEHFRPKAGCRQGKRTRLERPGYYWLVYEWDNLLLACPICNQRFKKNFFPLIDPSKRAKNHHSDLVQEEPLFLNPAEVDPASFIGFRQEVPYAIQGNKHARETINALGTHSENLSEERRDHLKILVYMRHVLDQKAKLAESREGRRLLEEAKAYLFTATQETAKFTAMAKTAAAVDFRMTIP